MEKLTTELAEQITVSADTTLWDSTLTGFGLRVSPTGVKTFVARAKVAGRMHKLTLGRFPTLSVSAARREARIALDAYRRGETPEADKRERAKAVERNAVTVADLADRWLKEIVRPKRKPRTVADYEGIVAKEIKPALGTEPVKSLTFEAVNRFHASMSRTPRRANYVVSTLRALLNFAEDIEIRPRHSNPCRRVEFFRERARERFLSEEEIGAAADAIEQAEQDGVIGPHAAGGLRLALLTGARSGEVTAIQWSHIDFQRRIIRLPDSKTNEPRTIELSEAAIAVIKTLPRIEPFVIAGAVKGEPYKNLTRAWGLAREYANLQDVRLHDLRHSYASLAASKGHSLQMIGKLLGHKVPATTQRYAHLARDAAASVNDELGAAMLAAIEKRPARQADNVVKLRQPRKTGRVRKAK